LVVSGALGLLIICGFLAYLHWFKIRALPEPWPVEIIHFQKLPLIQAAQNGNVAEIRKLISRRANVNATGPEGVTALMAAALSAPGAVPDLLAAGANVNAKDNLNRETALYYACRQGDLQVVEELVNHGAEVNTKTMFDRTPLEYAVAADSAPVVQYLLKRGAKLSGKDGLGFTELTLAVVAGRVDIVKLLLKAGADVNARDSGGLTALAIAESNHDAPMIRLLKQSGAR
jgi:ankyrin repeat protein